VGGWVGGWGLGGRVGWGGGGWVGGGGVMNYERKILEMNFELKINFETTYRHDRRACQNTRGPVFHLWFMFHRLLFTYLRAALYSWLV
jgi:hypothetical protein